MASRHLNMIVAVCTNRGIGVDGHLPWRLRGDMAFFKRITSETSDPGKKNAVIMGRKTWESIPAKFRPLPDRINVIISRTIQEVPTGAYLAHSLEEALKLLNSVPVVDQLERVFVIGGSSIYKSTIESPSCFRIYLTQVMQDFDCDTFLPEFDTNIFRQIQLPEVDSQVKTEGNVQYRFEVYQKDKN